MSKVNNQASWVCMSNDRFEVLEGKGPVGNQRPSLVEPKFTTKMVGTFTNLRA